MRYQGSGATLPEGATVEDTDQHGMGNRPVSRSMLLQTAPQRTEAAGPPPCSLLHLRPGAEAFAMCPLSQTNRPAGPPRAARGAGVRCQVLRLLRKISAKQIALLAGERQAVDHFHDI